VKASTPIGVGLAFGMLALGTLMEGSSPMALINIPAAVIIFGGTMGATIAAVGMDAVKNMPTLYKLAFSPPDIDFGERRTLLVRLADKARRDGLLALEEDAKQVEDTFTQSGLQLVVDGTDPDLVDEVLANEIDHMAVRHTQGRSVFETGAGLAPTIGVLGTVMGLVHVLHNLSDPTALGASIAGAFICTLYGVGMANILLHPVNLRLKGLSSQEKALRMMTVEGILAIQSGESPRVIGDKLATFLPPSERGEVDASAPAEDPAPTGAPDLEMAA
jgi:chemotaxis protein MotA